MSRIRILGASAAVLLTGTALASAADLPRYGAPPPASQSYYNPAPVYSWSGPYVGVTGGYGWEGGTVSGNGWIGGAYAGANVQTPTNLVLGVEGDITASGKSGTSGGLTVSNPWDATLRGRLGYALGNVMIYGTGGLAVGEVKATTTTPSNETATQLGWAAGGGIEAALGRNVTGRVEYRYTDLGTKTFTTAGPVSYNSSDILAGLGFKY